MNDEQKKAVETFVTVRAMEVSRVAGQLRDALYWAGSAHEGYTSLLNGKGSRGGLRIGNDADVVAAELSMRREALREAVKLANTLGVDPSPGLDLARMDAEGKPLENEAS